MGKFCLILIAAGYCGSLLRVSVWVIVLGQAFGNVFTDPANPFADETFM
jgi:hypothetical protein